MPASRPSALTPSTIALLTLPPLLWAGNAIVGRVAAPWIPPITFNFLRWVVAGALLLPLAAWVLRPGSGLWRDWRRFLLLGSLAVAGYNMLQYLALHTSTPLNVTLVASSMPLWMMLVGRLFFGAPVLRQQLLGALLSLAGVLTVLAQGRLDNLLALRFVPGDAWMLAAALTWAGYSWLLTRRDEDPAIRADWAAFLLAQTAFGLLTAGVLTAGEWTWLALAAPADMPSAIRWSWPLAGVLLFVAVGPSILAYRAWGAGVQRAGPTVAGFFTNLTPLFTAVMSTLWLGEPPHGYHAAAFALIVAGIAVSSRR
ncbi:2A78: carboxylate/amino acid/amine transporter [Tepidimonas alkaliphilus]|uniref:2A78: carboxylate/amino acid/amine transporter n=1 Tax=Tepidimonas alkaliphilus TaxID=2588942 RepID=A0A554W5P0_9BURK|nr:DMT family transporter [Tepidimonas alkaliphilus]TSE18874.1 2A78: carboxylate/amino acid/amine transporter [Tepidimonas alkaliphilus]